MGVKLANPDLTVIAVGGDGDGFAIGAGHFPHAARRNVDITYLVMDNEIYGLTKGQVSPTSLTEQKAPSTPWGNLETPLNTLGFAVACGASFVARGASFNTKALTELIVQGIEHPGFAFIDALSPCVVFNNHQEEWKEKVTDVAPDHDVTRPRARLRSGAARRLLARDRLPRAAPDPGRQVPRAGRPLQGVEPRRDARRLQRPQGHRDRQAGQPVGGRAASLPR